MKIIRIGLLILPFLIFSSSSVYASSVEIAVKPTTVGNILLRVRTLDNEKVPDNTRFDLYEIDRTEELTNDLEDYELIDSAFSENSMVFYENIPFGEYFVRVSDDSPYEGYKRTFINNETVDTQHIPKDLWVYIDNGNGSSSDTDISEIVKDDFNSKGNVEQEETKQSSNDVSTGDKVNYTPYVFLALISSLLGIMLYRRRDASEES